MGAAERRPYERKPLRLHEVLELVEGVLGAWERDVFGRTSGREAAVGEPAEDLARGVPGEQVGYMGEAGAGLA